MSWSEKKLRFDELSAGLAMGDLSVDETCELASLADELELSPDVAFDFLANALESGFLDRSAEPLPDHLRARLEQHADDSAAPAESSVLTPEIPAWQRFLLSPLTGWAAAAAVAMFAWVASRNDAVPSDPMVAESQLRKKAADLIERPFQGVGVFENTTGKVVWSDHHQQGYMTLRGVPANNPKTAQYQLWIVDPTRDEAPVDGGVFDIPANGSTVVVPIVAKLAVNRPQAFVITLEHPGGVVKSRQEKVVALAKN